MGSGRFCRNRKHPIEYRVTRRDGRTSCVGCVDDRRTRLDVLGLSRMGPWQTPVHDEARARALTVWQDGLAAAIEEIRRTEGFNGRSQTWQALGEFLPPGPTSEPDRSAVIRFPLTPGSRRYVSNRPISTRMARFQEMAAQDIRSLAQ